MTSFVFLIALLFWSRCLHCFYLNSPFLILTSLATVMGDTRSIFSARQNDAFSNRCSLRNNSYLT